MTAVRVDPENTLAYIQAGADGGGVDHETALHNLVCLTGSVSHTGFAGVALGGGIGPRAQPSDQCWSRRPARAQRARHATGGRRRSGARESVSGVRGRSPRINVGAGGPRALSARATRPEGAGAAAPERACRESEGAALGSMLEPAARARSARAPRDRRAPAQRRPRERVGSPRAQPSDQCWSRRPARAQRARHATGGRRRSGARESVSGVRGRSPRINVGAGGPRALSARATRPEGAGAAAPERACRESEGAALGSMLEPAARARSARAPRDRRAPAQRRPRERVGSPRAQPSDQCWSRRPARAQRARHATGGRRRSGARESVSGVRGRSPRINVGAGGPRALSARATRPEGAGAAAPERACRESEGAALGSMLEPAVGLEPTTC